MEQIERCRKCIYFNQDFYKNKSLVKVYDLTSDDVGCALYTPKSFITGDTSGDYCITYIKNRKEVSNEE